MTRKPLTYASAIALGVALSVLTVVPVAPAGNERPFTATLTGNASLSPTDDPCILRNDETGSGESTHLGNFTWTDLEFVNFCTNPGGVDVEGRTFTMTAANGDELHGEFTTTGFPNADGNLVIHGTYQFTGGTGRFENATGSGDIDALAFFSPGLPFVGSLRGTIDY